MGNTIEPLGYAITEREQILEFAVRDIIDENGTAVDIALWMLLQELLGQVRVLQDKIDKLSNKEL